MPELETIFEQINEHQKQNESFKEIKTKTNNFRRFQIYVEQETYERIAKLAEKKNVKPSRIVKQAVTEKIKKLMKG